MSDKPSKTISNSMEETRKRHAKYLRAMNNPIRRSIIRAIKDGHDTIDSLEKQLKIDGNTLSWHIKILENGYCLETLQAEGVEKFKVTDEGDVVDYIEG